MTPDSSGLPRYSTPMVRRSPRADRTSSIMAREQEFKDRVRQMRQDRQLQPAPQMTYGTWSMDMNGSTVTAVRVTGDMSF
jgi:hypothetical protein